MLRGRRLRRRRGRCVVVVGPLSVFWVCQSIVGVCFVHGLSGKGVFLALLELFFSFGAFCFGVVAYFLSPSLFIPSSLPPFLCFLGTYVISRLRRASMCSQHDTRACLTFLSSISLVFVLLVKCLVRLDCGCSRLDTSPISGFDGSFCARLKEVVEYILYVSFSKWMWVGGRDCLTFCGK
jgi:hypothetical protein